MSNVRFLDRGPNRIESRDGRFLGKRSTKGKLDFTIYDQLRNGQVVGHAKSFLSAVSLCERYLTDEKKKEADAVNHDLKVKLIKATKTEPPAEQPKTEQTVDNRTTEQKVLATLAQLADDQGYFTTTMAKISEICEVSPNDVHIAISRFVAHGMLVVLKYGKGRGGTSYGFDVPKEQVLEYVQNMPELPMLSSKNLKEAMFVADVLRQQRTATTAQSVVTGETKPVETPAAGILAGKAMVRINAIEKRLDGMSDLLKKMDEPIDDKLRDEFLDAIKAMVKSEIKTYSDALDYLETRQNQIDQFLKDTFGVDLGKGA